jgi:hypothetical protein
VIEPVSEEIARLTSDPEDLTALCGEAVRVVRA